jgi:hypothetical protein
MLSMEGAPVRFLSRSGPGRTSSYMDASLPALRKALLRGKMSVYSGRIVALLSCLQTNLHDIFRRL